MTAHQFISILVRLAGLAMLCSVVRTQLPYLVQVFSGRVNIAPEDILALTISTVITTGALIMSLLPELVAGKLLTGSRREPMTNSWSACELQTTLVSGIALWMLFDGTVNASYWISYIAFYNSQLTQTTISYTLSPDVVGGIVSTIVQLVLGFFLLINAIGFSAWLRRVGGAA